MAANLNMPQTSGTLVSSVSARFTVGRLDSTRVKLMCGSGSQENWSTAGRIGLVSPDLRLQLSLAQSGATRVSNKFGNLSELSEDSPDVHDQLEFLDMIEGPTCPKVGCPIIPKDNGFKIASQMN